MPTDPNHEPEQECDIVLQGGTASGVIYPRALAALARRYRLRGIGGTSAGAMAAAVAAAAEYGRVTGRGGFGLFDQIPHELGRGRMLALFQPQPNTRTLLRLMLILTGGDRMNGRSLPNRIFAALGTAVTGYPPAAVLGALPGLILIILGIVIAGPWAIVLGAVLLVIVELVALLVSIMINLTRDVPENSFGMCTGLTESEPTKDERGPALTEWLANKINAAAGLQTDDPPLTFGQLWTAGCQDPDMDAALKDPRQRRIDLRVTTTCLSESRPYDLPFAAHRFFYDPDEWRRIFPPKVMAALEAAAEPRSPERADAQSWEIDRQQGIAHSPGLCRLPDAQDLPVIIAARMSLSMPLVISAVPLWVIERADEGPDGRLDPTGPRRFVKVWFSDGGLSNNFPVQLFDAALPTRPTYAINLQSFPPGVQPDTDEADNVEWAHGNNDGLAPKIARWPNRGIAAVAGFLGAIYTSSSSWQDTTQLSFPGFRDRIVRVLQTKHEGGINLAMDDEMIERLARRGERAADAIMNQFAEPHYPPYVDGRPTSTGWDNHRWVRYRALLSVLPDWAESYGLGRAVLGERLLADPPSYRFGSESERELAGELDRVLDELARVVEEADPQALAALTDRPRPVGVLRRMPQV
ncbi:patatin-like phospholipase domain-containing protein [Microlunatus elymi]|nr:patatin-like phospholipase family protein [Microlunatus elymi]